MARNNGVQMARGSGSPSSPSKSSHYSLSTDAVGRDAQVIITVPSDGLGEITFDNVSGRVTLGARSATGKQIVNGQAVRIEEVTGRVALVRPVDELDYPKEWSKLKS